MNKKVVGVLGGSAISFIDHLVPLCQILDIPLLCTDPWVFELIELYYPPMSLSLVSPQDYCLDSFLKDVDALVFVFHYKKCEGGYLIGDYILHSSAKSIYALHGNSDKKRNIFWVERSANEDIVLFYGDFMIDFHKEKGVYDRIPHPVICGNYRLEYYKENQSFFQKKIAPLLFPKNGKKTILYAPTWTSPDIKSEWRTDYSSFFEASHFVLDKIPEDLQIYVKTHPYHLQLYPEESARIREKYSGCQHIRFIDDLPLIYPLLEEVDIYLGDYSSIGYDFLTYNRPLFFLNAERRGRDDKGVFLYNCGVPIEPENFPHLYSTIEKHLKDDEEFRAIREKTYKYAFAKKTLKDLKNEIAAFL